MTAGEKYGGRGLDGMATVLCLRVPRPCEVGLFRRPDAPATSAHTLRAPLGSPTLETCSKWVQSKISFLDIHIHVSLPFASTVLELSSSTHVITADLHVHVHAHVHVHRVGPRHRCCHTVRQTYCGSRSAEQSERLAISVQPARGCGNLLPKLKDRTGPM